jgi:hypothetical protein
MRPLFAAVLVTTLTEADPYVDVPDRTPPAAPPSVPTQRRPVHDQDRRRQAR